MKSIGRVLQAPRLWVAYLAGGAVTILGYLALPTASTAQKGLVVLVAASAFAAVLAGILVHEPNVRTGWLLLATAQLLRTIGDAIGAVKPNAVWADACYLGMYVLLTAALVVFVRRRTPGWDAAAVIDAAVVAISAGVIWWLYLIVPLTRDGDADVLTVAVPAMDLLVLVVALRLVLGTGARTAAYRLLTASLVLMLCADVAFALRSAVGTQPGGAWAEVLRLTSYLALGAAAVHPSMRWLDAPARHNGPNVGPVRLGVLVLAALLPVLLLGTREYAEHVAVVVTCTTAAFLLVVARLLGLAGTERQAAIADALTGLYADGVFRATLALDAERALNVGESLGLVLVEIDNFGVLAEAYGQPAADRVLCELADRLRARCRPGDLVARIGPYRFGVLLPGLDAYEATRFAAILRIMVCDRRIRIDTGTALRVTVTLGVGSMPAHAVAPRHLMRAVAGALSAGVVAGGNRTHTPNGPVNLTSTTRDLGLGSSPGRHRESKIGEGWWAEGS